LGGLGVVVARAEVVEAAFGIEVLSLELEAGGRGAGMGGRVAVGVIGVGADDRAGAVGDRANAADSVGV
jgi:hypothetical protein